MNGLTTLKFTTTSVLSTLFIGKNSIFICMLVLSSLFVQQTTPLGLTAAQTVPVHDQHVHSHVTCHVHCRQLSPSNTHRTIQHTITLQAYSAPCTVCLPTFPQPLPTPALQKVRPVLPLSISSTVSLYLKVLQQLLKFSSSSSIHVYPFFSPSFQDVFLKELSVPAVSNPVSLHSSNEREENVVKQHN